MSSKIVYQTDSLGIYVGPVEAEQSPLEKEVWLIPRGCVEVEPPAVQDNTVQRWNGQEWALIDVRQGLTAYNTATAEAHSIDRGSPLPAGFTFKVPGPNQTWNGTAWEDDIPAALVRVHAQKYQVVNNACAQAITSGLWSSALGAPHQYSSQLDDQLNLTGAVLRGLDMPYACRDEQAVKEFRLHTAEQLRQVGDDFTLYKLQLLQHANELKQHLDAALAAGDLAALEAITWEAEQP